MRIAPEGYREILIATVVLGAAAAGSWLVFWPIAPAFVILWLWVLTFFRDPKRERDFATGELCSPADGTVTEISQLDEHESIDGPVVRIGIFLSLFNVHVNRSPCAGRIRSVTHKPGLFLDARHPDSGSRNESNTLVIDPDAPLPGPVVVRQVAGLVARRIICHANAGDHMPIGFRFGMIKFGSRTELIIPRRDTTEVMVSIGDKVQAGLTVFARQPVDETVGEHARTAEKTTVSTCE